VTNTWGVTVFTVVFLNLTQNRAESIGEVRIWPEKKADGGGERRVGASPVGARTIARDGQWPLDHGHRQSEPAEQAVTVVLGGVWLSGGERREETWTAELVVAWLGGS